jgi:hypothetical protein
MCTMQRVNEMSTTIAGLRSLGKVLRLKLPVEEHMPADMEVALLHLAAERQVNEQGDCTVSQAEGVEQVEAPQQRPDLPIPHRTSA